MSVHPAEQAIDLGESRACKRMVWCVTLLRTFAAVKQWKGLRDAEPWPFLMFRYDTMHHKHEQLGKMTWRYFVVVGAVSKWLRKSMLQKAKLLARQGDIPHQATYRGRPPCTYVSGGPCLG